jgi:hypothetical protein
LRGSADAQDRVAALEEPTRDRVEDLVEHRVADLGAAGELDEWQRERLPGDGEVAGAEDVERGCVHGRHVRGELVGVVVGARAVRTCHQHEHLGCVCAHICASLHEVRY